MNVDEVFKQDPKAKEKELNERLLWLRKVSLRMGSWSLRDLQTFCIEWQEVTGKLLEACNRPSEAKFKDAEKKRRQLKEIQNRGIARK